MTYTEKYCLIRSFVRRAGRITPSQRHSLETLWPQFGIEYSSKFVDFSSYFGRQADVVLEIGFGNGESLLKMAKEAPELDFIGVEVHAPGVGALLTGVKSNELQNLRVISDDAVKILTHMIKDRSLSKVQIFFPDPWPKRRHQKRRLIQAPFVKLLHQKLKAKGLLHLATDWEDYARQMMRILSSTKGFKNRVAEGVFYKDASSLRPMTKFERRGLRLEHPIWDLLFIKE